MTQNFHITLKEKLVLWVSKKLHGWKQYVCKHPVKICCITAIILCIGNFLYWGIPRESSSYTSPNGRYKITYYYPEYSFYGWMQTIEPYFVKVSIRDGEQYRYACTSPIFELNARTRMHWPTDSFDAISDSSEYSIPAKPLREGFISFTPTLERICPNRYSSLDDDPQPEIYILPPFITQLLVVGDNIESASSKTQ